MRKITLITAALLVAASGFAQDTLGIQRPKVFNEDGTYIYDDFAYITTNDFPKGKDGATVTYYESDALKNSIKRDETTESGYAKSNLRHWGVGYDVDYVWKLNCSDWDESKKCHNSETLGSEGYEFGFDVTIPDGKHFTVDSLDLDLLVEQNPIYQVTITGPNGDIRYDSNWITGSGSYSSAQWGMGTYMMVKPDAVSFYYPDGSNAKCQYSWFKSVLDGTKFINDEAATIPENLALNAGTYKVRAKVDLKKNSEKGLSFDHFMLYGELGDGLVDAIKNIQTDNKVQDNRMFNLAGQQISAPMAGQIYIMNGKKYIGK